MSDEATERRQHLSERDLELIDAVLERSHRGCPDLSEEQCAALPAMIAEWGERVEAAKLRRAFWREVQMKGVLYGLLALGLLVLYSVIFGGKEALPKVIHLMAGG